MDQPKAIPGSFREGPGLTVTKLFGGPLHGRDVWVPKSFPQFISLPGDRKGNHSIWITHVYIFQNNRYDYFNTQTEGLTSNLGKGSTKS
jgi:hypothetical protein